VPPIVLDHSGFVDPRGCYIVVEARFQHKGWGAVVIGEPSGLKGFGSGLLRAPKRDLWTRGQNIELLKMAVGPMA
jgi:hypothetical protein